MKKILIIDDMFDIVQKIRSVFKDSAEYQIVGPNQVLSLDQAFGLIKEHQPDIIGLDMNLTNGGREGVKIAKALFGDEFSGSIITISDYRLGDLVPWVVGYGVRHYAAKDAEKFALCVAEQCRCKLIVEAIERSMK